MPQADLPKTSAAALAALMADPASAELLKRRARDLARPDEAGQAQRLEPYVRFRLGRQQEYGVPHHAVDEVMTVGSVARVPCAPPAIVGVVNRRGQMLPVVDLRRLFRIDADTEAVGGRIDLVVVSGAGITVGLRVDELIGSEACALDDLDLPPPSQSALPPAYLIGLHQGRIALLDITRILSDLSTKDSQE